MSKEQIRKQQEDRVSLTDGPPQQAQFQQNYVPIPPTPQPAQAYYDQTGTLHVPTQGYRSVRGTGQPRVGITSGNFDSEIVKVVNTFEALDKAKGKLRGLMGDPKPSPLENPGVQKVLGDIVTQVGGIVGAEVGRVGAIKQAKQMRAIEMGWMDEQIRREMGIAGGPIQDPPMRSVGSSTIEQPVQQAQEPESPQKVKVTPEWLASQTDGELKKYVGTLTPDPAIQAQYLKELMAHKKAQAGNVSSVPKEPVNENHTPNPLKPASQPPPTDVMNPEGRPPPVTPTQENSNYSYTPPPQQENSEAIQRILERDQILSAELKEVKEMLAKVQAERKMVRDEQDDVYKEKGVLDKKKMVFEMITERHKIKNPKLEHLDRLGKPTLVDIGRAIGLSCDSSMLQKDLVTLIKEGVE